MLCIEKKPVKSNPMTSTSRFDTTNFKRINSKEVTSESLDFPSHGKVRCQRLCNKNKKNDQTYGNYLDEVWTKDTRSGGVTVADLNENAVSGSADRHFYHCNTLYSVYGLTDEAGNVVESYMYDSYGRQTVITDGLDADAIVNFTANDVHTLGGSSLVGNPWMYTGQRLDAETGFQYSKNRYLSLDLGKWMTRDPIGYGGGSLGLYEYVNSRPILLTDILGFKPPLSTELGQTPIGPYPGPDPWAPKPQPDRPIDETINTLTYNCSGLAFRNYKIMNLNKTKKRLEDCTKIDCSSQCQCGQLKCCFWEYDLIVMGRKRSPDVAKLIQQSKDFHIVCGEASAADREPHNVCSKNGLWEIDYEIGTAESHSPKPSHPWHQHQVNRFKERFNWFSVWMELRNTKKTCYCCD